MARKEKTDPGALQRLKNDLRAGQLGPLYLFYGPESYLRPKKADRRPGGVIQLPPLQRGKFDDGRPAECHRGHAHAGRGYDGPSGRCGSL